MRERVGVAERGFNVLVDKAVVGVVDALDVRSLFSWRLQQAKNFFKRS